MNPSLVRRILGPVLGGFIVLTAVFTAILVQGQRRAFENDLALDRAATRTLLESRLEDEAYLMEAVLRTVAADERLIAAFERRDVDRLLGVSTPLFQTLRDNHSITHLYFNDVDGVNILRTHRPEQRGDTIPRWTQKEAMRTGEVRSGLEIGRLRGLLTLRVVLPWRVDGRLLGYLELGQEVDRFATDLARVLGVEAYAFVPKSLVDRNAWELGMEFLGRRGEWERFPLHVVSAHSTAEPPDQGFTPLLGADAAPTVPVSIGDRRLHAAAIPLTGPEGEEIGRIVVARDRRAAVAAGRDAVLAAVGICVVVGLSLGLLLLRSVRRYFSGPLRELQRVAGRAGRGELTETVTIRRNDELGDLGRAVNRMILDLRAGRDAWERRLLEAAIDGVVTLDRTGRIEGWNSRATELFGWTEDEAIGRRPADVGLPCDAGEGWVGAVEGFEPDRSDERFERLHEGFAVRRDGTRLEVQFSVTPVESPGGWRFCLFLRDVTAERGATRALRTSEHRYRHLVESAGVIPWVGDAGSRRITYVGPQAEALLGEPVARWTSEGFGAELIHPEDRDDYLEGLALAGRDGAATLEYRMVKAEEGSVFIRDIVRSETQADGRVVLNGIRLDISEQARLERQLVRSQKMEAVGRLAGGVAHDFNNLMTVVLGNAALLETEFDPGDPLLGDLREITEAANRASDLTQQLLAFASRQIVRPEPVEFAALFDGIQRMLRRLLREDILLQAAIPDDLWPALADPGRIEQVLMNLAVNARDAMPTGGRLTFEAENTAFEPETSIMYGIAPGEYVMISVSDTGTGMSRSVQARIFEPFFTTKGVGEGTGLGLATCLGIVQQAGGTIRVYSEVGRGTTFRVFLPRAAPAARAARVDARPVDGGSETVLVVEDDAQVASVTRRALHGAGYRVLMASDGNEAVRVAQEFEGPIHLLLSDLVMPFLGGEEAVRRILRSRPESAVLYMTGYSERLVDAGSEGMPLLGELIVKPFTPVSLLRRVRSVLDRADGATPPAACFERSISGGSHRVTGQALPGSM